MRKAEELSDPMSCLNRANMGEIANHQCRLVLDDSNPAGRVGRSDSVSYDEPC
jgi:hypothetical protein